MQLLIKTVLNGQSKMIYYDTQQILASIQLQALTGNSFFGTNKQELEELSLQMSTWK